MVLSEDIIGVFDLDTTTISSTTRDFLKTAEQSKAVINTSYELPKSFVLHGREPDIHVYVSQLNTNTLKKRFL